MWKHTAILALGVGLLFASISGAAEPPDREALVRLRYDSSEVQEYRIPLSEEEFRDLRFSPRGARDRLVEKARARLARRQGYFRSLYGEQADRIQPSQVVGIQILDHRLRRIFTLGPQGLTRGEPVRTRPARGRRTL